MVFHAIFWQFMAKENALKSLLDGHFKRKTLI
jgi:hypothetical protein